MFDSFKQPCVLIPRTHQALPVILINLARRASNRFSDMQICAENALHDTSEPVCHLNRKPSASFHCGRNMYGQKDMSQ